MGHPAGRYTDSGAGVNDSRRTYISLMLEAGAPLPYVMDQVRHADSKTTLEIYAQVQKRVLRKNAHAAFDELLNGANRGTVRGLL